MAIKIALGKLTLTGGALRDFAALIRAENIGIVDVSGNDAMAVGDLPRGTHKDPFDRLIATQCLARDLTLISIDKHFDAYGVRRLW